MASSSSKLRVHSFGGLIGLALVAGALAGCQTTGASFTDASTSASRSADQGASNPLQVSLQGGRYLMS